MDSLSCGRVIHDWVLFGKDSDSFLQPGLNKWSLYALNASSDSAMLCGWIRAHCLGPRTFYYYDQFLLLAAPPASLPGNKSSGVNILMKMLIDVISTGAWGVWGGGGVPVPQLTCHLEGEQMEKKTWTIGDAPCPVELSASFSALWG